MEEWSCGFGVSSCGQETKCLLARFRVSGNTFVEGRDYSHELQSALVLLAERLVTEIFDSSTGFDEDGSYLEFF